MPGRSALALLLCACVYGQASRPFPEFKPIDDNSALPRVLLIGDSISIGYTFPVRELLKDKANVHRIADNGSTTAYGLANLDKWLGAGKWDVIHFNFGLHDVKRMEADAFLVTTEDYERNLEAIAVRLKQTRAALIWASTTPVPEGKLSPLRIPGDEVKYNAIAARVMKKHGIEINDLWSLAEPQLKTIQLPANVHYTDEGSKVLGKQVAQTIERALTSSRR